MFLQKVGSGLQAPCNKYKPWPSSTRVVKASTAATITASVAGVARWPVCNSQMTLLQPHCGRSYTYRAADLQPCATSTLDMAPAVRSASAHQQSVNWRIGCSSLNVSAQALQTTRCASYSTPSPATPPATVVERQCWVAGNSTVEEQSTAELSGLRLSGEDSDSAVCCGIPNTPHTLALCQGWQSGSNIRWCAWSGYGLVPKRIYLGQIWMHMSKYVSGCPHVSCEWR